MKMKHKGNSYKKVPSYWWDFQNDCAEIVIESDHKDWPVLAIIKCPAEENSDGQIQRAIDIIEELKSGRLSHKECYTRHVKGLIGTFLDDIGYK